MDEVVFLSVLSAALNPYRSSSHLCLRGYQSAVLARGYEMFLSKHVPLEK